MVFVCCYVVLFSHWINQSLCPMCVSAVLQMFSFNKHHTYTCFSNEHTEGSRPEWCISSKMYSRDTPFWLETLYMSRTVGPSDSFSLFTQTATPVARMNATACRKSSKCQSFSTGVSVGQGPAQRFWAHMHHKVVRNFGSEADVRSLYNRRFRFNETSDVGACTHG